MKQAISYIRISNKDQSNFSLSGQTEYIKSYCERKEINILNSFLDNGQSAKNFDRADWIKLENFVKANHKNIDYLVVVKYDRFSRNVAEGLNMIEKLEKSYGIAILSVFEEMYIDPKSPFFFKMRADMLVQAEFELRVIKDRTNFGIRKAKNEGRWIGRAPYGYINARDAKGLPVILVDPEKALAVKKIFALFSSGISKIQSGKEASGLGYNQKSNSAITRILTNPVYIGLLPLDNSYVKGIHEPIIDQEIFNRVQARFTKEVKIKVTINDDVPLRGVLKCSCGRHLTAGKSKGKSRYYWYYKCKSHLEVNYSAEAIHIRIRELMYTISLNCKEIEYIKEKTRSGIKAVLKKKYEGTQTLTRRIFEYEGKLKSVEEKFISNQLTYKAYTNWNMEYNSELTSLRNKLDALNTVEISTWDRYEKYMDNLSGIGDIYDKLSTVKKQRVLNAVFNQGLKYRLNTFLTSYLMPVFASKAPILATKGLLEINSPLDNFGDFTISSGIGSMVELLELIKGEESSPAHPLLF